MDTYTKIVALITVFLYIIWLVAATLLYRNIDARYVGIVPTFRSHLQLFTDGSSLLALLRLLAGNRAKELGDSSIYKQVSVVRFLTVPFLISWAYFMYVALQGQAP